MYFRKLISNTKSGLLKGAAFNLYRIIILQQTKIDVERGATPLFLYFSKGGIFM